MKDILGNCCPASRSGLSSADNAAKMKKCRIIVRVEMHRISLTN
jgi:hypothetical protein